MSVDQLIAFASVMVTAISTFTAVLTYRRTFTSKSSHSPSASVQSTVQPVLPAYQAHALPHAKRATRVPKLILIAIVGMIIFAATQLYRSKQYVAPPPTEPGIITTLEGTGQVGFSGDGGPAYAADFNEPTGVAVDSKSDVFIADASNNRVREIVAKSGVITTIAGTGNAGYGGDGGAATAAELNHPTSVAIDSHDDVFIADRDSSCVREINARTHEILTIAGVCLHPGYNGDGKSAKAALLNSPRAVSLDGTGNLFIADLDNGIVRRVDVRTKRITTVAGYYNSKMSIMPTPEGDGGPATRARLGGVYGLALDSKGDVFITQPAAGVVRRVDVRTHIITLFAGMYDKSGGYSGDGKLAVHAALNNPLGVAVDQHDNLFIADTNSSVVRRVDGRTHIITTLAGTGTAGFSGDGGDPRQARLAFTAAVAVDAANDLFIADGISEDFSGPYNDRIRVVGGLPLGR
jgi:hypothetical protein